MWTKFSQLICAFAQVKIFVLTESVLVVRYVEVINDQILLKGRCKMKDRWRLVCYQMWLHMDSRCILTLATPAALLNSISHHIIDPVISSFFTWPHGTANDCGRVSRWVLSRFLLIILIVLIYHIYYIIPQRLFDSVRIISFFSVRFLTVSPMPAATSSILDMIASNGGFIPNAFENLYQEAKKGWSTSQLQCLCCWNTTLWFRMLFTPTAYSPRVLWAMSAALVRGGHQGQSTVVVNNSHDAVDIWRGALPQWSVGLGLRHVLRDQCIPVVRTSFYNWWIRSWKFAHKTITHHLRGVKSQMSTKEHTMHAISTTRAYVIPNNALR